MSEIQASFLSEHEGPQDSGGKNPGYSPDPEERKVIKMVEGHYSKAKKYRKRYDQNWIEFYKNFRGRQWKEMRPSYRSSEVVNLIFETLQSMIPILVDAKPRIEFLPTVPTANGQMELADVLTKVAANDWEHNNWLTTLIEILYDSHFYGNGFAYVGFDPKAEMGLGAITFESSDPFYFFPDPNARDIQGKRTCHIITAEPTDISQLKKDYPDKAAYISSDVMDFAQGDKADIYQVMFKSPVDSKLIIDGPSGYDSIAKDQALKVTLYSKDDSYDEEEVNDEGEDGTPRLNEQGEPQTKFVQKLKYPKGRKIIIAGGVLLEDGEAEWDDGDYPFVKMNNYILPREFWSVGEVENLQSPQKAFNKINSFILDTMNLMGNPIYIVDDTSGIDTDNLINKPGLVIEKTAGSEVRRESGVELPTFILPYIQMYKQFFDGVSGQTDLSRGLQPTDVTAASAIEDLQQAQQTRLRLKAKHIDAFLQDFGKLYISRVFQCYSAPRIVRVSGDTNASEFFYFHVEQFDGEGNKLDKPVAVITDHQGQSKRVEILSDFDVRVSTASSLPFAKRTEGERAMKLFQLGIIDDEEVLKDLDYPNYETVLARVNQKKQAMQQQQMQMAGQMQQAKTQELSSKAQSTAATAQKTQIESAILAHQATHPQPAQPQPEQKPHPMDDATALAWAHKNTNHPHAKVIIAVHGA